MTTEAYHVEADNDSRLWQLLQAGDITCFDAIYHRHAAAMALRAYKVVKDLSLAKDITQDVFVKLYVKRQELPATLDVAAYLHTAVKNRSLNTLRDVLTREKHHQTLLLSSPVQSDPAFTGEHTALRSRIATTIDNLPGRCGQAFKLSYYENMSYKAIAGRMNLSVKTVEKHIGKALHILRSELGTEQYLVVALALGICW